MTTLRRRTTGDGDKPLGHSSYLTNGSTLLYSSVGEIWAYADTLATYLQSDHAVGVRHKVTNDSCVQTEALEFTSA